MKGSSRRKTGGPPTNAARKDRDEDLLLFHEMLRRERERTVSLLQPVSDEFEANPAGNYPLYRIPSGKKGGGLECLNMGNDKNDYDWLKTPPATPLFPSLEMEAIGPQLVIQREIPVFQPVKYSRFFGKSEASKHTHDDTKSKPNSAASSRSVTPILKSNISSPKLSPVKPISLSSDKTIKPATDFTRKSVFPENVTKSTTILRKTSAIFNDTDPTKTGSRNVTESKPRSRGVSPLVRSRIPSTLPGFSNETPPNLKTAVSDRSTSASRGRPANPAPPDTKPEGVNPRRQSCSPSVMRGRKPDPKPDTQKEKAQGSNGGIIFGSRMVEKVMNARKSVAGEEKDPKPRYRVSSDVSGFGRMLSKSSLDMALKHTEIKVPSTNYPSYYTGTLKNSSARRNSHHASPQNSNPIPTKEEETESENTTI